MTERIIKGDACVREGAEWLCAAEPRFAKAFQQTGPLPLRLKPDGFGALLNAIVSQQVSVASASAIWKRLADAGFSQQHNVAAASDDDLRACGLSRPKVRYARALAEANLDFPSLRTMETAQVLDTLIKLPGIGIWTAEIYAMFSLGRADVFAPGDLALQESARLLFELDARPNPKLFREMAQIWSPWRSVAARLLWAYYRVAKNKEGIT